MFSEEEEPATLGDGDLGHGLHPLHGAAVTADHHLPLDGECLLEDLYLPEEFLGILGCEPLPVLRRLGDRCNDGAVMPSGDQIGRASCRERV